ncbi:COG1 protein, partial [Chroicocephalus maculipennis]|nr:COG1 protein [Chroicocephalus maculipennis]
ALFEAHTAAELRAVERRLRAGIEQKREELRQMVGERYRDLIEAADTIAEMRLSADRLLGAVRGLQRGGTARPAPAAPVRPPAQESFYRAAAQLKLLLEVPEKVWGAVEGGRYLPAARLHLLGAHLRRQLQLETPRARGGPILARFPILLRQVAAASHLRWDGVARPAPRRALGGCLVLGRVVGRFRRMAWRKVPYLSHMALGPAHPFSSLPFSGLSGGSQTPFIELPAPPLPTWQPCLPLNSPFSGLCPYLMEPAGPCHQLQPTMVCLLAMRCFPSNPSRSPPLPTCWLSWVRLRGNTAFRCSDDIRAGVSNLLVYVKSMKGLAGIRDAVWELLTSESISQNWEAVCRRLLDKPTSFWEDLLQQLFLDRLQALTKEGFDSISSSSKQLLTLALQELEVKSSTSALSKHIQFEHNVALFLWSESSSDLPSDAAWVSVANRGQFAKSGLSMKAQALTPCVQSFCSALDSKLKARLDDLLSYLPTDSSAAKEAAPVVQPRSAFDRYADAGTVEGLLRDHCVACIHRILGCVREELQSAQSFLEGQADAPSNARLNAVLFMARLCQSLTELCPHLKQCILGQSGSTETVLKETRSSKKLGKGKAQGVTPVQAKWQGVKAELLQQSLFAYQIWSSAVTKNLVQCFTRTLLLDTAGSVLATATNWDEIEIQEETESGNSVTSKIRLPVQPSWYVQCLLFSLCQEVNRVGGHTLPKVTLQELLRTCMAEVLAAYEKLVEEKQEKKAGTFPMTQNRALQLLYDLRYLSIILTAKSEEAKTSRIKHDSGIEKVTDFLEGHIDPFDLDVFTPHLNSNLNRLVQRTSVLFGLLTGTENQYTSRSGALSSQELHNILPLASSQIRFGLLPLSMSSSRKSKSATRSTERVQVAPALTRAEDEASRPGSLFRQLVAEEEDTAAPSLFKLGWLSGMTK